MAQIIWFTEPSSSSSYTGGTTAPTSQSTMMNSDNKDKKPAVVIKLLAHQMAETKRALSPDSRQALEHSYENIGKMLGKDRTPSSSSSLQDSRTRTTEPSASASLSARTDSQQQQQPSAKASASKPGMFSGLTNFASAGFYTVTGALAKAGGKTQAPAARKLSVE